MPEQDVTFPSGDLTLAGTLTRPERRLNGPLVLLVVGSGPIDRNSDVKRMPLGITRQLADRLADNGIPSLRFDKRGIGASEGDYRSAGFSDNVTDASAGLEFLRRHPDIRSEDIFVVGHSEGALIASAIAASGDPIAGVVLLSGAARRGEEVLRWQASRLADMLPRPIRSLTKLLRIDVERSQIKRLEKLKASSDDVIRMQGLIKVNAKWFREFMAFDAAKALAEIEVPVLAITGAGDVQVDPADVELMGQLVQGPFEGHVVPGVNHILRTGGPSPTSYRKQVGLPLDARTLDLVLAWIDRHGSEQPRETTEDAAT